MAAKPSVRLPVSCTNFSTYLFHHANLRECIADPRFTNFNTDPRFRLPSRKYTKVKLDKRFSHMLHDADFSSKARVDRYGRKLAPDSGKRELQRFYRLDGDESESDSESKNSDGEAGVRLRNLKDKDGKQRQKREERKMQASLGVRGKNAGAGREDDTEDDADHDDTVEKELRLASGNYDPARDGGFSTSSSDESDDDDAELEEEVEIRLPHEAEVPMGHASSRLAVVNLDWDNIKSVDLLAVASSFVPSSGRILDVAIYPSEYGREQMELETVKGPSKELFINTLKSNGRASTKGHPVESSSKDTERSDDNTTGSDNNVENDEEDEDEEEGEEEEEEDDDEDEEQDEKIKNQLQAEDKDEEYSSTALRTYQLDRLRYFYAVITCSSTATAKALYESMDGREYLSSANFFDLRFIPEDTSFENDEERDSCDAVPDGYRPAEFVTDALTRSKVKLTWDADDRDRKEVQKRAFSRAEIDENDLMAYIGSASSSDKGDDDEDDEDAAARPLVGKKEANGRDHDATSEENDNTDVRTNAGTSSKRTAKASALRAALGLPTKTDKPSTKSTEAGEKARPVGDLQVTWTPAFSDAPQRDSVFANAPEETTRERYIRKEKERKARRKERMKEARTGGGADATDAGAVDETATIQTSAVKGNTKSNTTTNATEHNLTSTDPFADPFFTDPAAAAQAEKKARKAAKEARRAAAAAAASAADNTTIANRAELELLMAEDNHDANANTARTQDSTNTNTLVTHHFDMNEIARAEKKAARRKKSKRQTHQIPNPADDSQTATTTILMQKEKKERNGDADANAETRERRSRRYESNGHDADGHVDDYKIDVSDPRFAALYESHEYAIDPTNARFKGTRGMRALLEEGRRVRGLRMGMGVDGDADGERKHRKEKKKKKEKKDESNGNLQRDVPGPGEERGDGIDAEKMLQKDVRNRDPRRDSKLKLKRKRDGDTDVKVDRETAGNAGDDINVDALIAKIKRSRNK